MAMIMKTSEKTETPVLVSDVPLAGRNGNFWRKILEKEPKVKEEPQQKAIIKRLSPWQLERILSSARRMTKGRNVDVYGAVMDGAGETLPKLHPADVLEIYQEGLKSTKGVVLLLDWCGAVQKMPAPLRLHFIRAIEAWYEGKGSSSAHAHAKERILERIGSVPDGTEMEPLGGDGLPYQVGRLASKIGVWARVHRLAVIGIAALLMAGAGIGIACQGKRVQKETGQVQQKLEGEGRRKQDPSGVIMDAREKHENKTRSRLPDGVMDRKGKEGVAIGRMMRKPIQLAVKTGEVRQFRLRQKVC